MMLKAFTIFQVIEDHKVIFKANDIEDIITYMRQIHYAQHSGRFKNIYIECVWNPDLNMAFLDECIEMKLDDIKTKPQHIEEEKHIEEVRQSIERDGLRIPLSVDLDDNLLDGHHRYRALKSLGIKWVLVLKKSIDWYKNMEYEARNGKKEENS